MLAYIDATGFHLPAFPDVLARRQAEFRAIFGSDVYLEPDSQEGQMVAMYAAAEYDFYQLAHAVYNSFSPITAQGAGLSRMVKINGIARHDYSHSSVDLTLTGTAGTIITDGLAKDEAEQIWVLPRAVVIPVTGQIIVTATAREPGTVQAAAGDVQTIATPTRGWQSVTNAVAATPGRPVEHDAALRQRQQISTALPSQTVLDGIAGAIANLPATARQKIYENDKSIPNEHGMPGHSIAVVVDGGDAVSIAATIAAKKTPGALTLGDVSTVVVDSQGMPGIIRFYRPTEVAPVVAVTIKVQAGYLSATGKAIQAGVAKYLGSMAIGEDVLLSKLYTPINAAEPKAEAKTFDVVDLKIARDGAAPAAANLDIAFVEVAVGAIDNVTVTVVGD